MLTNGVISEEERMAMHDDKAAKDLQHLLCSAALSGNADAPQSIVNSSQ